MEHPKAAEDTEKSSRDQVLAAKSPENGGGKGGNGEKLKPADDEFDDLPPLRGKGDDEISLELVLPPDGGYGWVIALASFLGNMIVDGVCYTFAVIFNELLDHFEASKSKTALVGALVPAVYLLVGPIVGALCNRFGCRIVAITGSLISTTAFVLSTFSPDINFMLLTYGFLGGVGFGLMYLPAIVMVGHYFDKKRALATGIAVCGSGVGTFVFAPLGTYLVRVYGWKGANMLFGGIILQGCIIGALYRPLDHNRIRSKDVPKSKIFETIAADKKKRRTPSFDSIHTANSNSKIHLAGSSLLHSKPSGGEGTLGNSVSNVPSVQVVNPVVGSSLNLGHSSVSLRINRSALAVDTSSQHSINKVRKDLAKPFARKDVLYGGSVTNLQEYRSAQDMADYVAKMTDIKPHDEKKSKIARFFALTMDMFKFELLKSLTFLITALAGVFFFAGLYTPFVYVTEKAEKELKISPEKASLILFIVGLCNTITRLIVGWVADRRWVDLLIIHNVAGILAGLSTALVSVLSTFPQLCAWAAFFGVNMACFIALRSVVVVELLGVEKLNNAYGLVALFQGTAVLFGSPMSGALVDVTGGYFVPFIVVGILMALGGVICLPVRRVAKWENDRETRRSEAAIRAP